MKDGFIRVVLLISLSYQKIAQIGVDAIMGWEESWFLIFTREMADTITTVKYTISWTQKTQWYGFWAVWFGYLGKFTLECVRLMPTRKIRWANSSATLMWMRIWDLSRRHLQNGHDDVIKWKHFRVTGHLCRKFTGHGAQRPVTRMCEMFFDLRLNKRLSKQSWDWWSETPSHPLWRHCNGQNIKAWTK